MFIALPKGLLEASYKLLPWLAEINITEANKVWLFTPGVYGTYNCGNNRLHFDF
jgi:hypothetical protein